MSTLKSENGRSVRNAGKEFEQETIQALLKIKGAWIMRNGDRGMGEKPPDILALHKNKNLLIECKATNKDYFDFALIKEHQIQSLLNFEKCGNNFEGWVLIKFLNINSCLCFRVEEILDIHESIGNKLPYTAMRLYYDEDTCEAMKTDILNLEVLFR